MHLEVCSGIALTEVSPSLWHESRDTLWGANTPWQNTGSSHWLGRELGMLLFSTSYSKCGGKHPAWKNKAPSCASASVSQFPQLLKCNQRSCLGTGHPKHFHELQ